MDITNITDDMIGKKITCYFSGNRYTEDAEITKENNCFYILQNIADGFRCRNTKNYAYSYNVYDGSIYSLKKEQVTQIKLKIPIEPIIYLWI